MKTSDWLRWTPLVVFVGLAATFGVGLLNDPTRTPSALIGSTLPRFDLPDVRPQGPGLSAADFEGQASLLNVYASWCPSCIVEHPLLMQLTKSGSAKIYGVAWKDGPGLAAAWLDKHGDPYLKSGDDGNGRLGLDLGVTGAPETFVIDKAGRIRHRHIGPITPRDWNETIEPLLAAIEAE